MRLVAIKILVAVTCFSLARSQKPEISAEALEIPPPPPIKLDKNLRQALLRALTELEAESAEQRKDEDEKALIMTVEKSFEEVVKKNLNKNIGVIPKATFSFDGFPGDEEIPNEEKLQNSSFLESKRYVSSSPSAMIEKASHDDARSYHVQNVVLPDKTTTPRIESKAEAKTPKTPAGSATVSKIESITLKPITQLSESLTQSASNGIAGAGNNGLVVPKPTASSPTVPPRNNVTSSSSANKDRTPAEEVKIFQAPLVAAFTVQQDELGIPKSIVPIYRQLGDGQALTLQEQLEFKQKLLEQQLAELQQQQIQQTQFLVRQRQIYDQQLRQKQQQLYLQEQARIKHLEEQAKIKQLEEQRLKQLEEQRIYRLRQHNHFPLSQKPHIFEQSNVLPLQPPLEPTVHLQPSVSLEVPSVAAPPLFRTNYQEQLHFQQFRQPSQPQPQLQPQLQPAQHQQRLQQNFVSFPTDFQPPVAPATRFNRQEAFNAIGNFGLNVDNKQAPPSRNAFNFNALPRNPNTFVYNPYLQFRQIPTRAQTPAKQIQHLLYQSGVAGELGNVQGPGGEDLNIVSKVLALNVGALPNKNYQYTTNNRGKLGSA
ncbi:PREDICTED: putative uncharacterized protein DDB_G0271606 isoform X2 [Wasmannia auropunctata]|uniref:putative uncharacterized protein DDB_G0271606 isoform X1 n=1 Tax=Wasmannia auropunctata TaxID=64793 RepID=UPI0005EE4C23|nr:PREDICTED: putative uncharacterized protein DDB_G0271606 isoform X1 [Wasmannia auropunctata]XP_011688132.1 PREDICTED: putative uncharacterized protein DDB_G0271606 isoform X2 [Wasmannia auropunctata]